MNLEKLPEQQEEEQLEQETAPEKRERLVGEAVEWAKKELPHVEHELLDKAHVEVLGSEQFDESDIQFIADIKAELGASKPVRIIIANKDEWPEFTRRLGDDAKHQELSGRAEERPVTPEGTRQFIVLPSADVFRQDTLYRKFYESSDEMRTMIEQDPDDAYRNVYLRNVLSHELAHLYQFRPEELEGLHNAKDDAEYYEKSGQFLDLREFLSCAYGLSKMSEKYQNAFISASGEAVDSEYVKKERPYVAEQAQRSLDALELLKSMPEEESKKMFIEMHRICQSGSEEEKQQLQERVAMARAGELQYGELLAERKEPKPEVMEMPEMEIRRERGLELLSAMLHRQGQEAKELEDLADPETLNWLAAAYEHPERTDAIFEKLRKDKGIEHPEALMPTVHESLEKFAESFDGTPAAETLTEHAELDMELRGERMEQSRAMAQDIIEFFRPDPESTKVRKVTWLPTDPYVAENTGRGITIGDEYIIASHRSNELNQRHEFTHSIINPIVEKVVQGLTPEEEQELVQLASGKHKKRYGEGSFSILAEGLIHAYTDLIQEGRKPETYEDFSKKIEGLDQGKFEQILDEEPGKREQLQEMDITNVDELKARSREYYDRWEKDDLSERLYQLYQNYANRPDKTQNFEQFALKNM